MLSRSLHSGLGDSRQTAGAGFTIIEAVVSTAVMLILASAAIPVARHSAVRSREVQLRSSLRQLREAIDTFKQWTDARRISATELTLESDGYPLSLEQLVEGVVLSNDASGRKRQFLRRIPVDPMTGRQDWGLRSSWDTSGARSWGGQNVFDVYSKSEARALNGSRYRDW